MKSKNKILIFILLLIMCSGCTIKYDLEITGTEVKEKISINDVQTENRTKENIYNEFNVWFPAYYNAFGSQVTEADLSQKVDNIEYHEKNIKELDDGYTFNYKYTYPLDKFADAQSIRQVYSKSNFYIEDKYISINTNNKNKLCNYSNFKEMVVSISVDEKYYFVQYNNADEVKDNKYTWKFDRNNCEDSKILLTLNRIAKPSKKNESITGNKKTNNEKDYTVYIIYGVMIIILLLVALYIQKMKEKNDKFDI